MKIRYTHDSLVYTKAQLIISCLVLTIFVTLPCGTLLAAAAPPIELGTAANFGALAGGAISGTGDIRGDVGSGTGAIAPAITSSGTIYPTGHSVTMTALADFATAYNDAKNRTYDVLLSAAAFELGGSTLTAGVYKIGAAATLTSPVTLDGEGNPDAVFIIQINGALGATASVGNVVLTNEAQSANVFWVVEGAVSMGANTHMEGTLIGAATITFAAPTTIHGRALAGSAAGTVTLATTTVSVPVEPSVVGGRVWLDSNGDGIQDLAETTGIPSVPVTLLQVVSVGLTIDLGTAANFGALAGGAISGTGNVAGHVGSGTGAIAPAITSTGTIFSTGDAVVVTALADFSKAYEDAMSRAHNVLLSAAAYELGGSILTPGVYKIGAAATLASPLTLDGEGDPDAVFIIQVVGAFGATAEVGNVNLINDAHSANVFWVVEGAVSLGAGTHMEGTLIGADAITFGAATTINGRALAGSAAGTVALATTTISAVTGIPPVGTPPPIVLANTVTDTNGNYLFGSVEPGNYIVSWDLSSASTNVRITTANQGSDDALDSDGVSGDVGGYVFTAEIAVLSGTSHLSVDLGLFDTLPEVKAAALNELAAKLESYIIADFSNGAWTTLNTAKTVGDNAINAATDLAGVVTAKDATLAAMNATPTIVPLPIFTDFSRTAEGAVTMNIRTTPFALLTLETSTDLVSWTTITTATPITELWTFIHDASLATGPKWFYRASLNP